MKRKIKLLTALLFSLLFLVGFGKKSVELLSNKKLIDLDAAIQICMPGAESQEKENGENTKNPVPPTVTPTPVVKPTTTPQPTATPKPTTKPKPRAVVINVRDCTVTCGSTVWEDFDALKERIAREANSSVTFHLVDDFAEAHVYRKIIAILEELDAELGISYIRD